MFGLWFVSCIGKQEKTYQKDISEDVRHRLFFVEKLDSERAGVAEMLLERGGDAGERRDAEFVFAYDFFSLNKPHVEKFFVSFTSLRGRGKVPFSDLPGREGVDLLSLF